MRIKTSGLHIEIGVVYKTLTNVTSALIIVLDDKVTKQLGTFVQHGEGTFRHLL